MPLKKGDFVRVTYTLKVKDGPVVETTDEAVAKEMGLHQEGARYGPRTLILGADSVLPGLEEELLGKEVGHRGSVTVPPEKGFGPRKPELVETFTVAKFPEPPYPGMEVSLENRRGVVETVIGRRVRVDFNHPLAGRTLVYDYKIEERLEGARTKLEALGKMVLPVVAEAAVDGPAGALRLPAEVPPNLPVGLFRLLAEKAFEHLDLQELRVEVRFPNPKAAAPEAAERTGETKPEKGAETESAAEEEKVPKPPSSSPKAGKRQARAREKAEQGKE